MKKFYLFLLIAFFFHPSFGRIRNGYEEGIENSRTSLQNLYMMLREGNLTITEKLSLKPKVEKLVNYISYYELTDEFIRQFRIVAPIIFTELDNIKDKKERNTDVYIRLVSEDQARTSMVAASFFERMAEDEDANVSRYGPYSVSVDISIGENALFLLSHELGHIRYIVPNLATYFKFYDWNYRNVTSINNMGHSANDPSGQYSHIFERRFLDEKKTYLRNGGKKPMSLFPLLTQIRKSTRNRQTDYPLYFASNVP